MGKRGPAKTPTALKKRRGTDRKDREVENEVEMPDGTPNAPDFLSPVAVTEWRRVVSQMAKVPGLLSPVDRAELAIYCQAWADWCDLVQKISEQGRTVETPQGFVQSSPLVTQMNQAAKVIQQSARQFGFTPASRTNISIPDPKPSNADDFFADALRIAN